MRNNKATSKGDQPGGESRALQILALIGPVAAAVASLAWAVSVYFIEREKYRAQVELARLEVEAKKQGFPVSQPGGSRSTPKLSSLARRKPATAECQSNFR